MGEHLQIGKCILAGAGFLADAYDLFVINLVKDVLGEIEEHKAFKDEQSLVTSMALWGAVLGQLVFGGFADYIGRKNIFVATLVLTTLGSLVSAFCVNTSGFNIYRQLAICRFILGFGVGGEYPLSATVTSEASSDATKGRTMALVFSMQGLGMLLSSGVMAILLRSGLELDMVWRVALGFGAVPGLIAFYFRWRMHESNEYIAARSTGVHPSHWQNMKAALKQHWKAVLGTSMAWFILDITFYGNGLFTSTVTAMFHKSGHGTLLEKSVDAVYIALIAIPGYYLTVAFIDRVGRKNLQVWGFLLLSIFFFILGGALEQLKAIPALALVIYGCTFLFSNFGPNATTYIIPGEYYPAEVRATCHGISAAAGKLGAAVTSYTFLSLEGRIGTANLLHFCGGVGILGLLWTVLFVPDYHPATLRQMRMKGEEAIALVVVKTDKLPGKEGEITVTDILPRPLEEEEEESGTIQSQL